MCLAAEEGSSLALSSLALSFSPIGEGGGVALGAALLAGRLPQLQTLQVQGCALGAELHAHERRSSANARTIGSHCSLIDVHVGSASASITQCSYPIFRSCATQ